MKIETAYNKLMNGLCLEFLTVGTKYSEDTEGWNARDMVSEAQYQLDKYFEGGTTQNSMYDGDFSDEDKKMAKNEVLRLQKFINKYRADIDDLYCVNNHCSMWDNKKSQ